MLTKRINSPDEAAHLIKNGGIVAFPTETVFGLGVDATNTDAIKRLFEAKGRPSDNPLIVHVSDLENWSLAAAELTSDADTLLTAFAPGPITVVLPKRDTISSLVSAGLETIGIRIPSHPIAREIIRKANTPVAAPSANQSRRPSSTTWQSVLEDLDGRVDAVYCENTHSLGIESTVVDCCGSHPVVLRPGAVTIEQIRQLIPGAEELRVEANGAESTNQGRVNSPGLLHPHYQPRAAVQLVEVPSRQSLTLGDGVAYCGLLNFEGVDELTMTAVFNTVEEYAAGFYEFLREADRQAMSKVYVQVAPDVGIGRALLDRQRRAAAG